MAPAALFAAPANPPKPAPASKPAPAEDVPEDVVVTGKRLPQVGAVVGDIKPELQLSPADIQSYGVSTVTELLDELASQTRSDRGRGGEAPVVLLNGHRISSFNEIRDIPTEAILRVDILPEEVSLKYGYSANQRVVNIVLRRRFRAITGEGQIGAPTEGGQIKGLAEGDLLHLRGDNRLNIDLKYQASSALTDNARNVIEPTTGAPFDLLGNVVSPTGGQIDPGLSALVGAPVTVAGVPAAGGARRLTLADFAGAAGVPNVTDLSRDRTLLPATQAVTLNGVLSRPTVLGAVMTLNGTLGATTSDAKEGLAGISLLVPAGDPFSPFGSPVDVLRYPSGFGPLTQTSDGWTGHLGMTINKDTPDWRYSLTSAYDHSDSLTVSDAGLDPTLLQAQLNAGSTSVNPFGALPGALLNALPQTKARALSDSGNVQIVANGPLAQLPAGALYTSLKLGDTVSAFDSRSFRGGLDQHSDMSRNDLNAQMNLDVPLLGDSTHILKFLGDVSLNANAAIDQLSDFGLLKTYGYGMKWSPLTGLNFIASQTHDQAAPTSQQLDNPLVVTPGQRVFDYATGQTVQVTVVTGGNAALVSDSRTVSKLALTYKPFSDKDLTFSANYIYSDIKNPIATFPAATAQIENAFSSRFTRDSSGELTQVDYRPVNFADQKRSDIRWGINFTTPVGPAPPPRPDRPRFRPRASEPDGADAAAPPAADRPGQGDGPDEGGQRRGFGGGRDGAGRGGAGGGRGGGGFGGGGGPASTQGRLQFAIYHTVYLTDQILARPGVPVFDLLNGSAAGGTGGQPRQEVEGQLGYTQAGFGARFSADWKSGTTVRGTSAPTGDLDFSSIGTINLRLFANLGQMPPVVKAWPILRGSRITLSATNLFDTRQRVHDATGATPLGYQAAYLDPAGRVLTLSLRKLFF